MSENHRIDVTIEKARQTRQRNKNAAVRLNTVSYAQAKNQQNQGQGKRTPQQKGANRPAQARGFHRVHSNSYVARNQNTGRRNGGRNGNGNGNNNKTNNNAVSKIIMPGSVSDVFLSSWVQKNNGNQSLKSRRTNQLKADVSRNKMANKAKKIIPKVDRNTEIILDSKTKKQTIVLKRSNAQNAPKNNNKGRQNQSKQA